MLTSYFHPRLRTLCVTALLTLATPALLFPVNFNAPRAYPLYSQGSYGIVVGDFNCDHLPDLAVVVYDYLNQNYAAVEIFLGQANGGFHAGAQYTLPNRLTGLVSDIVAGDFNHNGKLDLA